MLARLLARADVFVQNLAPGAADRLGTAPRSCARATRGSSSAPCPATARRARTRRRRPTTCWSRARSGCSRSPARDDAPAKVGISVADIAAGMYAYSGILTALLARAHDRRGARRSTSRCSTRSASGWAQPAYYTAYGGAAPPRSGAASRVDRAVRAVRDARRRRGLPRRSRTRASGRGSARDVLRRPELADDARFAHERAARAASRRRCTRRSSRSFARAHRRRASSRASTPRSIACARMNSIARVPRSSAARRRATAGATIDSPAGPLRALLPPVQMDGVEPVMGAVPALGQHTDAILEELGFDARHDRGVAAGGSDLMAIKQGWTGRVFEDFEVGDVYEHPLGRTITRRRQRLVHVPDDEHEPDSFRRRVRGADRVQAAAGELVLHAGARHRPVGDRSHR